MGQFPLTHDPCRYFAYTVKLASRYQKSKNANEIRAYELIPMPHVASFHHLSGGGAARTMSPTIRYCTQSTGHSRLVSRV